VRGVSFISVRGNPSEAISIDGRYCLMKISRTQQSEMDGMEAKLRNAAVGAAFKPLSPLEWRRGEGLSSSQNTLAFSRREKELRAGIVWSGKLNEKLGSPLLQQVNPDDNDNQLKDRTMGRMLGDNVWLMSQSPAHKHFSLADLEWRVMPPLALGQYRIFRNGEQPLGVALWAYLSEETEKKLEAGATRLMPQEWAPDIRIDAENGMTAGEGGSLWLIDLICPSQTPQNKLADICLHDLMTNVFSGKRFKMFQIGQNGRKIPCERVG